MDSVLKRRSLDRTIRKTVDDISRIDAEVDRLRLSINQQKRDYEIVKLDHSQCEAKMSALEEGMTESLNELKDRKTDIGALRDRVLQSTEKMNEIRETDEDAAEKEHEKRPNSARALSSREVSRMRTILLQLVQNDDLLGEARIDCNGELDYNIKTVVDDVVVRVTRRIQALQAEIFNLKFKNVSKDLKITSLNDKIEDLNSKVKCSDEACSNFVGEMKTYAGSLRQVLSKYYKTDSNLIEEQDLADVVDHVKFALDALMNRTVTLEKVMNDSQDLQRTNADQKTKIGVLRAEMDRHSKERDSAKMQFEQLQRKFNALYTEYTSNAEDPDALLLHYDKLCVICYTRERNILVLPCKHVCICRECSKEMQKKYLDCPVCRVNIQSTMNVFL